MKESTKKNIRKRVAFIILILGSAVVYRYYSKKNSRHKVSFIHKIRIFRGTDDCFLSGEISEKEGEVIWNGEFKIRSSVHLHSMELLPGEYRASFKLQCGSLVMENIVEFESEDKKVRIVWKQ